MEYVKSFRELEVYKLSRQLSRDLFEISKKFPKEEMYSLTDQIRRSSRSIGASRLPVGTEAWAKRRYEKHFVSKLTDADGEQLETQHWIETALDCSYLSQEIADNLLRQYTSIGKMLYSMMNKAASFLPAGRQVATNPITEYRLLNTDYQNE